MADIEVIRDWNHLMEDESKREFERLIEPWANQGWNQRDYGIDATIEIFSDANLLNGFVSDCKVFMAQLKATKKKRLKNGKLSLSIPTKKIFYWYNFNVPILFAVHDQNTNEFFTMWIDEAFINLLENKNPNWSNKQSVSIQFSDSELLDHTSLTNIKRYVLAWKSPTKKIIEPGHFFKMKEIAHGYLKSYEEIVRKFSFKSVSDRKELLFKNVDQSIYRISITGFSRVGKSSFINKFLDSSKREISPTGIFQTTGVPIQVVPSSDEKLEIEFEGKPSLKSKFSEELIKNYVSQDFNEDNHKKVSSVTIGLRNIELEKGISIFDIPGLDDPDDNILSYTNRTIRKSNAIIYLIDGSSMEHGGYIFSRHHKSNIEQFGKHLDKIFFVVSKVDVLSKKNLIKLKDRIHQDLDKFKLKEIVGDKIYFMSNVKSNSQVNSMAELREDIWSFMLSENKYGIHKLSNFNSDFFKAITEFTDLLNVRLVDKEKKKKLLTTLNSTNKKLPELRNKIIEQRENNYNQLSNSLQNRKNVLLEKLEKGLNEIPLSNKLPSNAALKKFLSNGLAETLDAMNKENSTLIGNLKNTVDEWVEAHLKQLRNMIYSNSENRQIYFNEIESYEIPATELSPAVGFSFLGLAVGLAFNFYAFAIGGILSLIGQSIPTEQKRKNRIRSIVLEAKKRYDTAFNKIEVELKELINENLRDIAEYVNGKLNRYLQDMNTQIESIDVDINEVDSVQYNEAINELNQLKSDVRDHQIKIEGFLTSI